MAMEVVRGRLSGFLGSWPPVVVVSSLFGFAAGWFASHWVLKNTVKHKPEDVINVRTSGSAGNGIANTDSVRYTRGSITCGERRLANEAANELIRAIANLKRDVRERDGQGICDTGCEVNTGLGRGSVFLFEDTPRVYDSEDDDHTY
nr:protein m38.5 [Mastomys natalensis cytomegalovirus 3]WEG69871.1 protein m38.5 [Mastomys natalensis cytomegalovirus 3]WEG70011.1 protein m38.5 [Mastomys natalensis cytomegalovirus 3]WEG70151.1 protein m38.5 [Mastomys natalensis cytomegalovirus 3]WEG70291.1 protein m38.5 [Mastomys natalensis cytomegalovirus 3]